MTPETQYAENDGVSIVYQVFGDGPYDLIYIPGWLSNLDIFWEEPRVARFLLSLARFSRAIVIDRRGTGLSDRVAPPTLEVQMGDVTSVQCFPQSMFQPWCFRPGVTLPTRWNQGETSPAEFRNRSWLKWTVKTTCHGVTAVKR